MGYFNQKHLKTKVKTNTIYDANIIFTFSRTKTLYEIYSSSNTNIL